jgi:hypothetical protein
MHTRMRRNIAQQVAARVKCYPAYLSTRGGQLFFPLTKNIAAQPGLSQYADTFQVFFGSTLLKPEGS